MLVRDELLREMQRDAIQIDPFDETLVGTNSIDLRLGKFFIAGRPRAINAWPVNHLRPGHVHRMWSNPQSAQPAAEVLHGKDFKPADVGSTVPIIILPPRGFLIGHTEEFVRLASHLVWTLHARSSSLNWGINPVSGGDLGDVLYCGRLRLFIQNLTDLQLLLFPGFPYVQLTIERCQPTQESYQQNGGRHHHGHSIAEAKLAWKPEMLYPKSPRSRDLRFLPNSVPSAS